jgi:hypothetical protein
MTRNVLVVLKDGVPSSVARKENEFVVRAIGGVAGEGVQVNKA